MSSLNASTESLGGTSFPSVFTGFEAEHIWCDPSSLLIQVPVEHRCSVGCGCR